MAAQQYNNNSNGGGYGQSNPYDTRDTSFDSRQQHNPPSYGHNSNVEMQPLNGQGAPYSQTSTPAPRDPNAILNDCRAIGRAIDGLQNRLSELEQAQRRFVSGNGGSAKEVDSLSADIMTGYRGLADRVRRIKSQREAGEPRNKPQVDALDRRTKGAITAYQQNEASFRRQVQEQQARQYRIVRPDATDSEVREATEDGGDVQIFQQALMQSNRQGQAQSTLNNVRQRHDAIQQIERTMMELQQLFQDLDRIVVEQDPIIENIETKAVETHDNVEAGNVHVGKAVDSARAARKKKWICLGICVAIILVIVIIILIWAGVTGKFSSSGNKTG